MAHADTENRFLAHKLFNLFYSKANILRVPRTIGQEDAVRICSQDGFGFRVSRENRQAAAASLQGFQNVFFYDKVVNSYMEFRFVATAMAFPLRGNAHNLVSRQGLFQQAFDAFLRRIHRANNAFHNAVVTDAARNSAGIHFVEARDTVSAKVFFEYAFVLPVRREAAQFANY